MVSPTLPLPRGGGFALRVHALARELARAARVHLLVLRAHEREVEPRQEDFDRLREMVDRLTIHDRPSRESARFRDRMRMMRAQVPPGAQVFCGESTRTALADALEDGPDVVLFESVFPAVLAPAAQRTSKVIIDEHNVEYRLVRDAGRPLAPLSWSRIKRELHWRQLRSFESQALKRSDLVLATSEVDRRLLQRLAKQTEISVVPNGVEVPDSIPDSQRERDRILFTGLMSYPPNVDAVCWFARDILPELVERHPGAHFVVAGAQPTREVLALDADEHITVTGEIEDMNDELDRAHLVVVPLRKGSGTRLKILEAWGRGKPIVTTSKGCEGLNIRPGEDVILANRPSDFVACVAELLDNEKACRALGRNGFDTAKDRYSWTSIGHILRDNLSRLTSP